MDIPDDPLTKATLGSGAIFTAVMLLRRIWRQISAEAVETKRDGAEGTLLSNLRGEIERMGADIIKIKASHEADIKTLKASHEADIKTLKVQHEEERAELTRQIKELRDRLDSFGSRFSLIRIHALDAYSVLSGDCACDNPCRDKLRDQLQRILKEGEQ